MKKSFWFMLVTGFCGLAFMGCVSTGFEYVSTEKITQEVNCSYTVAVFSDENLVSLNEIAQEEKERAEAFIEEYTPEWIEWKEFQEKWFAEENNSADVEFQIEPFYYDTNCEVIYGGPNKRYVTVGLYNWTYTGGAHGNYYWDSTVWDRVEGRTVNVLDVTGLSPEEISSICVEEICKQVYGDCDQEDFNTMSMDWILGGAGPDCVENMDFYVKGNKVFVVFDPYEVAAYAYGMVEVRVK